MSGTPANMTPAPAPATAHGTQAGQRRLATSGAGSGSFGQGATTPPPTSSILIPQDGSEVAQGFSVYVQAGAARGIGAAHQ